jgi:hypothetical protein
VAPRARGLAHLGRTGMVTPWLDRQLKFPLKAIKAIGLRLNLA